LPRSAKWFDNPPHSPSGVKKIIKIKFKKKLDKTVKGWYNIGRMKRENKTKGEKKMEKNFTWTFAGVIMTTQEYKKIKSVFENGTCPICSRTGLTGRYGSNKKHLHSCSKKYSILEKEKVFAKII